MRDFDCRPFKDDAGYNIKSLDLRFKDDLGEIIGSLTEIPYDESLILGKYGDIPDNVARLIIDYGGTRGQWTKLKGRISEFGLTIEHQNPIYNKENFFIRNTREIEIHWYQCKSTKGKPTLYALPKIKDPNEIRN